MQPPLPCGSRICSWLQKEISNSLSVIPPTPWQPLILLSLWICLFWIFHKNAQSYNIWSCVWLPSLSTMFSRFIHIVSCIRISLLFMLNNIPLCVYTHFLYPFMCRGTFGLFPPLLHILKSNMAVTHHHFHCNLVPGSKSLNRAHSQVKGKERNIREFVSVFLKE